MGPFIYASKSVKNSYLNRYGSCLSYSADHQSTAERLLSNKKEQIYLNVSQKWDTTTYYTDNKNKIILEIKSSCMLLLILIRTRAHRKCHL